jgi:hypothetical protein
LSKIHNELVGGVGKTLTSEQRRLGSILPGLASFPINRIAELTPTAWAARI